MDMLLVILILIFKQLAVLGTGRQIQARQGPDGKEESKAIPHFIETRPGVSKVCSSSILSSTHTILNSSIIPCVPVPVLGVSEQSNAHEYNYIFAHFSKDETSIPFIHEEEKGNPVLEEKVAHAPPIPRSPSASITRNRS